MNLELITAEWQRFSDEWPARCVRNADAAFAEYATGHRSREDFENVAAFADQALKKGISPVRTGHLPRWLPTSLANKFNAGLDDRLAERRTFLAEWLLEEQRSRRMARTLGRATLSDSSYVTSDERNWLTHPEMRGLGSLRNV